MKTFANPIGLRGFGLGAGMVNIFNRQVKLIFMMLNIATVFCTPVGQDP
jgi:succinate-acetate transporter protein